MAKEYYGSTEEDNEFAVLRNCSLRVIELASWTWLETSALPREGAWNDVTSSSHVDCTAICASRDLCTPFTHATVVSPAFRKARASYRVLLVSTCC